MLQTNGQIAISDICVELGLAPTTNISLNDGRCRKLAKKEVANSTISMSDFYGKANFEYTIKRDAFAVYIWSKKYKVYYRIAARGYKITANTPSDIVIASAKVYNSSGALELTLPVQKAASGRTIPAEYKETKFAVQLDGKHGPNEVTISVGGEQTYYTSNTYTFHKIALVDSNGNEYALENHRDLVSYCAVQEVNTNSENTLSPLESAWVAQGTVEPNYTG